MRLDIFSQASDAVQIYCVFLCASFGLAMSRHMRQALALFCVFLGVYATPVARGYEDPGPVPMDDLRTPDLPVPRIYALPEAPSVLDVMPRQTTCVQMTYGLNCYSR